MREFEINIVDSNTPYKIVADTYCLGRRYENDVTTIKITRPEKEIGKTCVCIVEAVGRTIDNIPITNNCFIIKNNISMFKVVVLGFVFYDEIGYIQTTENKIFQFAPALKPLDFLPVNSYASKIVFDLMARNLTSIKFDQNTRMLKSLNLTNDVKEEYFLPFLTGATINGEETEQTDTGNLKIEINIIDGGKL